MKTAGYILLFLGIFSFLVLGASYLTANKSKELGDYYSQEGLDVDKKYMPYSILVAAIGAVIIYLTRK